MSDEPEKKIKNIRDFAADLTAAMKKNADKPVGDVDEDSPESHVVPPARENLLRVLESDVDALGWDQPAKLWGVLEDEETGEEYLKLITTLKNHAPTDIEKMAKKGRAKADVKGVVVAVEAWAYPDQFVKALDKDDRALASFYRIMPPSEHPEKTETRAITMFNRDGSFACITRTKGGEAELIPAVDPALVPAVASLLGMEDEKKNKKKRGSFTRGMEADEMCKAIDQMGEILKFVVRAHDGMEEALAEGVSHEQYMRGVFEDLPKETRDELLSTMPRELKKMLGFDV